MNSLVAGLNSVMGLITGLILAPFRALAPIWGLVFLSAVTGVALLLVFGKVSNQAAIRRVKREIYAALLESVLFRHDLRLCLGAQAKLLRCSIVYFLAALPPVFILAVPCVLVMAQLNARYDARSFSPGEDGLITVALSDPKEIYDLKLAAAPEVDVSKPLRIPSTGEVIWKIKAKDGPAELDLELKGKSLKLPLRSGPSQELDAFYYRTWWLALFYPARLDIGSFPIDGITIGYPKVSYSIMRMQMHWLVVFLIISLLAGILASRVFKVEI